MVALEHVEPDLCVRLVGLIYRNAEWYYVDDTLCQTIALGPATAAEVMGASTELVDRVLDEYGDPAAQATDAEAETETDEDSATEDQYDPPPASTEGPMTEQDAHGTTEPVPTTETEPDTATETESDLTTATEPALAELTEKQQTTLRAVYEHPEATQRELAELLDISDSAVSLRLRNIDEFDWAQRQEFVTALFENGIMPPDTIDPTEPSQPSLHALTDQIDALSQQLDTLDHRLDDQAAPSQTVCADPDLAHKIAHACLSSG